MNLEAKPRVEKREELLKGLPALDEEVHRERQHQDQTERNDRRGSPERQIASAGREPRGKVMPRLMQAAR
jgi:hypothetical protein